MADELLITVQGTISGTRIFTEGETKMGAKDLFEYLPQMIGAMIGLVPQIEDPDHPLNGWTIESIIIENAANVDRGDEYDDDDESEC